MDYQDANDAFREALATAGVITKDAIIGDGNLHRFHVEGDKAGTKNGAYILHLDGKPSGYFEHFKSGIKSTWTLSGKREPLSLADRKRIDAERQQRQAEQAERHAKAAKAARYIWRKSTPISLQSEHPYLIKKRIQPHGLRLYRGALVVPIYSEQRTLTSLQFIHDEGNKRLLSGGRKLGCFSLVGDFANVTKLLIAEGYATAASLNEALGLPVLVAIDAGNLTPVAMAARGLFPNAEIVVMGDNDEHGKGQTEARKAALAVGGKYLIPTTPGQDWNDTINTDIKSGDFNG